jgi:hypothetical protein
MSGTITSGTVGDFGKGAKFGCLRSCGAELPEGAEAQERHNAEAHSQPQGGGTAYVSADKTKVK